MMKHEPAFITRDAATKAATLTVAGQGAWQLHAAGADCCHDNDAPLATGNGQGVFALPLAANSWARFSLRQNGAARSLAERHLPMAGGYNFRDLGGFLGAGGKRVAWGNSSAPTG